MAPEDQFEAAPELPVEPILSGDDVQVEVLDDPGPPSRRPRRQFLTGALVGAAVAAVFVLGGFLLGSHSDDGDDDNAAPAAAAWSTWKPSKSAAAAATEIAGHVGREYREPNGGQLVRVTGGPLQVAGVPLTVALRAAPQEGGNVTPAYGNSVLYRLCGLGKNCAISSGKPSIERHLLLRREALELALYSLRYLKDVDQVVVFLPPRLGDQPTQALFFRKRQVQAELEKPLEVTLVDRTPTVDHVGKSPDTGLVQQLTIPMLYRFSVTQTGQNDRAVLVLDPFDSAPPSSQPRPNGPSGLSLS